MRLEDERNPPHQKNILKGKFQNYKTSGKTKKKMGGRRLEERVTDPGNTRMEKTSRRMGRGRLLRGTTGQKGSVAP